MFETGMGAIIKHDMGVFKGGIMGKWRREMRPTPSPSEEGSRGEAEREGGSAVRREMLPYNRKLKERESVS